MPPAAANFNVPYGATGNIELSRQLSLATAGASDRSHVFFGQLGSADALTSGHRAVLLFVGNILGLRDPHNVICTVVGDITIEMSSHQFRGRRLPMEDERHQPMDLYIFLPAP